MYGRIYQATYGRIFAAGYDRALAASERAATAERRGRLLASARGATLEVGAGTGINLLYYPASVTELVLAEPSDHMARRLRSTIAEDGRQARVTQAPGAVAAAAGST